MFFMGPIKNIKLQLLKYVLIKVVFSEGPQESPPWSSALHAQSGDWGPLLRQLASTPLTSMQTKPPMWPCSVSQFQELPFLSWTLNYNIIISLLTICAMPIIIVTLNRVHVSCCDFNRNNNTQSYIIRLDCMNTLIQFIYPYNFIYVLWNI